MSPSMIKKRKNFRSINEAPQRGDVPILNFKTVRLPYQGSGHGPVSVDYCIHDYPCWCCSFNLPLCRMLPLWHSFKVTFACQDFTLKGMVVQMMNSFVHWRNHYSADKYQGDQYIICWKEIHPVDSIIQNLINWSQDLISCMQI